MKRDVKGTGMPTNQNDLTELLKETSETLALDLKTNNGNQSFGIVDLWNSQRNQRTAMQMRRRAHLLN